MSDSPPSSISAPAVSVIMPVYNAQPWVAEAVRSILAQTFASFELIIIDDGSNDGTLTAVRDAVGGDPRVQVISRPNRGLVATLNQGLQQARAPLIARMDGDDLCDPCRFELQVAQLQADPALVALGTCAKAVDPDGRPLGPADVPLAHDEIERRHLAGDSCIYHPSVMMRAEAVRGVGGYRDVAPVEDFDLWLRLGEVGRLANLPQRLFVWRRTATGAVASQARRRTEVLGRVLADAWQRRGLSGEPPAPQPRLLTRGELFRQWAWMALDASHSRTARLYAIKAMRAQPLTPASWKLLLHALRA